MDSDSLSQILLMLVMVIFSAYFSATETAFTSLNRVTVKTLAENGNKKAIRVMRLSEKYDKLLSTILVGNNIVNIALASVGTVFFIKNVSKDFGATLSSVVITVVVLVFGEVTPKNIAKDNAESFAMAVSRSISFFMTVFTPINIVFSGLKKLVSKIFKSGKISTARENEILTLVDEAEQIGEFDSNESELIRSAVEFSDVPAVDIFTPRVDIVAVERGSSNSEIAKIFSSSGYSRLPVYEDNIDNIIGTITEKEFYNHVYNRSTPVEDIIKKPLFITGSMKISDLLRQLQTTKQHIAFIADEYGGTQGLVTMEDILEELVGEIWDEHDNIINDIVENSKNLYTVLCSTDIEEFFDYFDIEDDTQMNTVGGWVMEKLGKVPKKGDSFTYENLSVSVSKVDERRAQEIKIVISEMVEEETN